MCARCRPRSVSVPSRKARLSPRFPMFEEERETHRGSVNWNIRLKIIVFNFTRFMISISGHSKRGRYNDFQTLRYIMLVSMQFRGTPQGAINTVQCWRERVHDRIIASRTQPRIMDFALSYRSGNNRHFEYTNRPL